MQKVTKAIIPAAGFATRFLPGTKIIPKHMFPIVDKPIIQFIVEELAEAGITDIIIVTHRNSSIIENHFDRNPELEDLLKAKKREDLLREIQKMNNLANFVFLRQKGPVGNAVPIYDSLSLVDDEPFLVFWGDDFIIAKPSRARQMITAYEKYGACILGAIRTSRDEDMKKYAFVKGRKVADGVMEVKEIIEKPGPGKAPSDFGIISGLYTKDIVPFFKEAVETIKDREVYYTEAINLMLRKSKKKIYAVEIKNGKYYDSGSKLGYLKTVVEFGLKHKGIGSDFSKYLKELAKTLH